MRISSRLGFGLVLALALVGFSSTSSATSQAIGFTDEVEACVVMPSGSIWLSTLALKPALEAATGRQATVASASDLAALIAPAGGGRFVRCENCQPISGSAFAVMLAAQGYTVETDGSAGALSGAADGWVRFTAN